MHKNVCQRLADQDSSRRWVLICPSQLIVLKKCGCILETNKAHIIFIRTLQRPFWLIIYFDGPCSRDGPRKIRKMSLSFRLGLPDHFSWVSGSYDCSLEPPMTWRGFPVGVSNETKGGVERSENANTTSLNPACADWTPETSKKRSVSRWVCKNKSRRVTKPIFKPVYYYESMKWKLKIKPIYEC